MKETNTKKLIGRMAGASSASSLASQKTETPHLAASMICTGLET